MKNIQKKKIVTIISDDQNKTVLEVSAEIVKATVKFNLKDDNCHHSQE